MEWLFDPTIWFGLTTLIVLEIVLGIDNLIFIAILADKLAPNQRQKARVIGLVMALGVRLLLLTCISWIISLDTTLFSFLGHDFSGHSLILLTGGAFLLLKATLELHEKLEAPHKPSSGNVSYASFWQVVAQIVVLDAVFSLDAVITAIGMVDQLPVMMAAVCIAIILMIIASGPLMNFVSAHPTVVVLCLGFLMMIGFSLVVEGLGYHVPKGYLYAAIGFSVAIETFNQLVRRNHTLLYSHASMRIRASQAVLSLMGGGPSPHTHEDNTTLAEQSAQDTVFGEQERMMIRRVLNLAEQSLPSIMTPRQDLYWIDLADEPENIKREIQECPYSWVVVAKEKAIEEPLGVIHKRDLADALLATPVFDTKILKSLVRQPLVLPDTLTILSALDSFKESRTHAAFIVDEYGTMEGFVTLTDVAEAIAGDMPETHEGASFAYVQNDDGSITVNGSMGMHELKTILGTEAFPDGDYNTAAGLVLNTLKRLPAQGDSFDIENWTIQVEQMDNLRVSRLKFIPHKRLLH